MFASFGIISYLCSIKLKNNRNMKKTFIAIIALLLTVTANAYDFVYNGIYYNLKGDGSLEVVGSSTTNVDSVVVV